LFFLNFFNIDITLRTQLTEFKDHNLIRVRKIVGVETIEVLIDASIIQAFLNKIGEDSDL
jgi:hypothetical protein